MPVSDEFLRLPCAEIIIPPDRQRRVVDTAGLRDSVANHGVLHPIIIQRNMVLVTGERRLAASRQLGILTIPCRFIDGLSQTELQIIELEENLKRTELHWRDQVKAVGTIHTLYQQADPDW